MSCLPRKSVNPPGPVQHEVHYITYLFYHFNSEHSLCCLQSNQKKMFDFYPDISKYHKYYKTVIFFVSESHTGPCLLVSACCHQYWDIRYPLMLLDETSVMRWNMWKGSPWAPHSIRTAKSVVETTSANHLGAHMQALSLKHKKAGTNRKQ